MVVSLVLLVREMMSVLVQVVVSFGETGGGVGLNKTLLNNVYITQTSLFSQL